MSFHLRGHKPRPSPKETPGSVWMAIVVYGFRCSTLVVRFLSEGPGEFHVLELARPTDLSQFLCARRRLGVCFRIAPGLLD